MNYLILLLLFTARLFAESTLTPSIIPLPKQMELSDGIVELSQNICIVANPTKLKNESDYLRDRLKTATGWEIPILSSIEQAKSSVRIELALDESISGLDSYRLVAVPGRITISGTNPAGVFYGIQTLRQLLPVEIESQKSLQGKEWTLPASRIEDESRFKWRGFMLDEARHFFGKVYVKQLLEEMALLKLNVLHWHLTDTTGWRLEILKYPKLTSIGGIGNRSNPKASAAFYTQDDIREIIAFAEKRHITIIPEIEMPGHATAAVRAYPEYTGGGSKENPDFTFNPASEKTQAFLSDILTETANLFPAQFLHFGGDEVHFGNQQWDNNPDVKKLMSDKGLKDRVEVERYFNKAMANVIQGLGKTVVGWDEIVSAGVPANSCIVQWWRHDRPNVLESSLANNYKVVLCPRLPCYFDFVQDESHKAGRRWGKSFCPLSKVYEGPKIPAEKSDLVLGLQACLWTETVATADRANFMIFPRLDALAEAAWLGDSPKKNFSDFERRLPAMLQRLDLHGVNYYNPFNPDSTPEIDVHGTRALPGTKVKATQQIND